MTWGSRFLLATLGGYQGNHRGAGNARYQGSNPSLLFATQEFGLSYSLQPGYLYIKKIDVGNKLVSIYNGVKSFPRLGSAL